MRMLAWINLLQEDGYVNDVLRRSTSHRTRSTGSRVGRSPWSSASRTATCRSSSCRCSPRSIASTAASSRRRGTWAWARLRTFLRVTLPLSKQGMLAAAVITALPMMGDYYTADLLSGSPRTSMVGNQIEFYLFEGSQKNAGASLVVILSVLLMAAMAYYLIQTDRATGSCSGDHARPGAWWSNPWRRPTFLAGELLALRGLVAGAGAHRRPVRLQRRSVPQLVAGLLVPLVVRRSDRSLWHDPSLRHAMFNSLTLAVLTMLIATPLGVALALGLTRWRGRTARASNLLMLVPLATPEIVMGTMLFLVFDNLYTTIPLGRPAMLLGHITFSVSYVRRDRARSPAVDRARRRGRRPGPRRLARPGASAPCCCRCSGRRSSPA